MYDDLRHFLLIAKHGTFTAAAERAHLSQPALSASVKRLEEDLGGRLFDRGRHGAELTAAGTALLPHASAIHAALLAGRRAVAEIEGLLAGEVRVAAGATATTYLLPKILARFRRKHEGIKFLLREGYALDIRAHVASGELDLGIVTGKGDDVWMQDELIVVASPKIDARRAGFLTFPEGSSTRELLQKHYGDVEIVMELAGIAAVKGNVRAGMGKALLSRSAVEADLRAGRLVEVRSRKSPIRRTLSLVHRGQARLPPAAAALRVAILG
ncbi:MAG: LysR family transcriptional regulator [Myxococcales bacterium]|nr:LysR family transcriptional regulator [Myxococcales bacterium]